MKWSRSALRAWRRGTKGVRGVGAERRAGIGALAGEEGELIREGLQDEEHRNVSCCRCAAGGLAPK